MKQTKAKFGALFLFLIGMTGLQAQVAVTTTGGNASGSGGTSSYTVGQLGYTTNTGTTGSVAQGVQQPYEISIVIGLEEAKEIELSCVLYPNPTTDFVNLKLNSFKVENISYQIFDFNGKLLDLKKVEGSETSIEMKSYADAVYFLKVFQGEKELKTFKIVKN
jgi:hypothetical protein